MHNTFNTPSAESRAHKGKSVQKLAQLGKFEADKWTKIIPKNCLIDRDSTIVHECRGKSVLHVGACDAPFEFDKGKAGNLLHQKVRAVARRTLGVDVDASAIAALRAFGVDDILMVDITNDSDSLSGETFDVVLCCDVIEHVRSPSPLLQACRRHMSSDGVLIVTTINATALKPALRALVGKEAVHNDHVAYYSFSTLGKLLTMEELNPSKFGVFSYPTVNPVVGWATQRIMKSAAATADGILFYARRS